MKPGSDIERAYERALERLRGDIYDAMDGAGADMERAAQSVLSGARTGRITNGHRASAPGEAPARASGAYAASWHVLPVEIETDGETSIFTARLATSMPERALMLEHGSGDISARPHFERIRREAANAVFKRLL